ncbi:MAG: lipocalin family protein [Bacteroidales bacterium]|nr:lipocalin family protein [Bacteroidales bacterium]
MKKAMFIASAALSLALVGCSGGSGKASENAEEVIKQVEDSATIIGSWVDADQKGFELVDDCSAKAINDADKAYLEWAANENGDTLLLISEADTATYAMQLADGKLSLTDKDGKTKEYTRK